MSISGGPSRGVWAPPRFACLVNRDSQLRAVAAIDSTTGNLPRTTRIVTEGGTARRVKVAADALRPGIELPAAARWIRPPATTFAGRSNAASRSGNRTRTCTRFATANPRIAEGLLWPSLCAAILKRFLAHAAQVGSAGTPISRRRVVMWARHGLGAIVAAWLVGVGLLPALRRRLACLLANARRANVTRDRRTGRLRVGLRLAEAPK